MEKAQKIKILSLTAIAIWAVFVLDCLQPAHGDYYQDAQWDAEMQNYRQQQEYRQREYEAQLQELRQQQEERYDQYRRQRRLETEDDRLRNAGCPFSWRASGRCAEYFSGR